MPVSEPSLTSTIPPTIARRAVAPSTVTRPLPTETQQLITSTPDTKAVQDAITMVRNSQDMADAAQPYAKELDWYAEQQGDKWWAVGLFESPWGVQFVQDATIWDGRVYAYVSYSMRPPHDWVISKTHERWGLTTFYTRLMPEVAIERVKESDAVGDALQGATVLDAVAELIEDNAVTQQWRFAFYVQQKNGSKAVLIVGGLGTVGAEEGEYSDGYGFGNATKAYWDIPLNFVDWVRNLVKLRGWTEAMNVK
jgi:hypothetical protein